MTAKEAAMPNFPTMARPVRRLKWSENQRRNPLILGSLIWDLNQAFWETQQSRPVPAGTASMSRQARPPVARKPLWESRRLKGRTTRTRERAGISTKPNTNCVKYRFVPNLDTPSERP